MVTPVFGSWRGEGGNSQTNNQLQKSSRKYLRATIIANYYMDTIPHSCEIEIELVERILWHDTKVFQQVEKFQAIVNLLLDLSESCSRKVLYDWSLVTFWMNKILLGRILVYF